SVSSSAPRRNASTLPESRRVRSIIGRLGCAIASSSERSMSSRLTRHPPQRAAPQTHCLDVGHLAEVLVILGVTTLALLDQVNVFNELDRLDPLDHLEAELVLDPKPQRRPVQLR